MAQFLSRYWTQIRAQLVQMPANTKLLIGSLVVILLLAGYLIVQYTASPQMVPITSFAGDRQAEVAARLKQAGIKVETESGQLLVPADQQIEALSLMESGGLLAPDTSKAIDDMLLKSSPWDPSAKTTMAFLQAKQKFLAQVIAKMKGVRAADVVISMPERTGFGSTHRNPSASVSVVMQGGSRMDKPLVDAIAGLIGGAVAEMSPRDVVVIDAAGGRAHRVADAEEASSDAMIANIAQLEARYNQKINDVLRYIPGVIVAVSVRTDTVSQQETEAYKYKETEPLESERTKTTETTDSRPGGESGIRSNVGADVNAASKAGSSSKTEDTETRYRELPLTERTKTRKVGQTPQEVNVTVNIPRNYFVSLFKHGKADAADPDDAALQPIVDAQLTQIKKQVEPLIKTEANAGTVITSMILDASTMLALAGSAGGGGGGGITSLVSADWFQPAILTALAVVSIGIMMMMARKATKIAPLPSPEELAGVPPQINAEEELLGEVVESEPAMTGVELDEQEVQNRKVAQQINELITKFPGDAANLFRRWIRAEE